MGISDILGNFKRELAYRKLRWQFSRLDEKQQRQVSKEVYGEIWKAFKNQPIPEGGFPELGGASVAFSCPYEGHISFHVKQAMNKEVADPASLIRSYSLDGDKERDWILTVIAHGQDSRAASLAADACAMATILKVPTASGEYNRIQFAIAPSGEQSAEEMADQVSEFVPTMLRRVIEARNR